MYGREGEGEDRRKQRRMRSVPALGTKVAASSTTANSTTRTIVSTDFFIKDGRKIRVGDFALFKPPQDIPPPFIGLIRSLSYREDGLRLGVNWLYRPAEVKLCKGSLLGAAPNEVFYSFHKDEILAASLLHPCKVAFLRKGVELPSGISSFVCRRVYDTTNKCLWWLTDKDYTNERQEEVDQLLKKTQVEMHAHSGGHSPKPLNGPTKVALLKVGSDSVLSDSTVSPSQVKGKKRARVDQGPEPIKQEKCVKTDDPDTCHSGPESLLKSEIAKITDKGGLVDYVGVEKLVQLMLLDKTERKLDLASRIELADVLASTDGFEFLRQFVQLRGLSVLDDWLQEVHKGRIGNSSYMKDNNKSVENFLLTVLRALDKLPVNLHALQSSNVGKSVNNLRSHKNMEIQKKARSLVDTWKKRVEAEMKNIDAKSTSSQDISWPSKPSPEISYGGSTHAGSSSVVNTKSSVALPSTYKTLSKHALGDCSARSSSSPRSVKASTSFPLPVACSSKDLKEERSSSSSHSQNNSQSCSSEHIKTVASALKEDSRSSTAGSPSPKKTSSSTSRHRRSSNASLAPVSEVQKNIFPGKSGSVNRSSTSEKVTQYGLTCDRKLDTHIVDHGNSHKLIVRVSSFRTSEKRDQCDQKASGKSVCHPDNAAGVNAESWQSNDVKDGFARSDEGDASPATVLDEDQCKSCDNNGKSMETLKTTCSSTRRAKGVCSSGLDSEGQGDKNIGSITALIESGMKCSEVSACTPAGDDGMNLLASVAAGEMSTSDVVLPVASNGRNSPMQEGSCPPNDSEPTFPSDDASVQSKGKSADGGNADSKKHVDILCPGLEDKLHITSAGGSISPSFTEEKKTVNTSTAGLPQRAEPNSQSDRKLDDSTSAVSPSVRAAAIDKELAQGEEANQEVNNHANNEKLPSCSGSVLNPNDALDSVKDDAGETRTTSEQRQKDYTGQVSNTPPLPDSQVGVGDHNDGGPNNESEREESVEDLSANLVEEIERCMKSSGSKVSDIETDETEECASNAEASSAPIGLEKATKLDFDLNESFPTEEGSQGDSVSFTTPISISASHQHSPLPYPVSSNTSNLTGLITVAASKGPFLPPVNLHKNKVELGWRGSAATSAFRPAEPRKLLELPLSATDSNSDTSVNKQTRPPLDIDLNVLDETAIEDMAVQSSPTPVRTAPELDFDLNRVDAGPDTVQFPTTINRLEVSHLPNKPTTSKKFDLNNGPSLDEVGSEPIRRGQHPRSSLSSLPLVTDFRMNNTDLGSISSWFPPCNSYPAVAIPSILPERGDHPHQRLLGPMTGGALPFSSPNPYPYPGFNTTFSGAPSTTYLDPISSGGGLCIPGFPSQLGGPSGSFTTTYPRPYMFSVGDGSIDNTRKWARQQGLDLNTGPGGTDIDERFSSLSRQLPVANSSTLMEDHMRQYQAVKRKEPEGGWDMERFSYKQPSWQ